MVEPMHLQRREDHLDSEHFGEYANLFHVCDFSAQKGQIEDKADSERFFVGKWGP